MIKSFVRKIRATALRCAADTSAVAAVEFAMILPLLALLMLGTFEICRVITAERRVAQIASLISDVVGRESSVTAADVQAIYSGAAQMLAGYDTSTLKISLIPVQASTSDATKIRVYPASTNRPGYQGGNVPAKCATYALTTGLLSKGDVAIVVETQFTYTPTFSKFIGTSFTFTRTSVSASREGCVDFDNNDCAWSCT